jgi:prepilin-type N-terminal cleavage/methylation domain-containing protein
MKTMRQTGFTIFELMIAVTVAGVVMAFGIPNLMSFFQTNATSTEVNRLVSALTLARGEAAGRGVPITVVPLNAGDWTTGWLMGTDSDGDGVYPDADDPEPFRIFEALTTATFDGAPDSVTFLAGGGVETPVAFTFLPNECDNHNNRRRIISVGPAGFVDLEYGDCP